MARRIKEDAIVHQNRIAEQANLLFAKKGIENTRMDEIAEKAGYSKATLYVYFKNKNDIVSFLSLQSMEKLKTAIEDATKVKLSSREIFFRICKALTDYQADYPDFFAMSQEYINVDAGEQNQWDEKSYSIGEEINSLLYQYLDDGIKSGSLREIDSYFETVFHLWGMISGIIRLASEKEEYIKLAGKVSREEFLQKGFERIYRTIEEKS